MRQGYSIAIISLPVADAEGLAIVASGDGDEIVGGLSRGQVKQRNAVMVGLFDALTPHPFIAVILTLPQLYGCPASGAPLKASQK